MFFMLIFTQFEFFYDGFMCKLTLKLSIRILDKSSVKLIGIIICQFKNPKKLDFYTPSCLIIVVCFAHLLILLSWCKGFQLLHQENHDAWVFTVPGELLVEKFWCTWFLYLSCLSKKVCAKINKENILKHNLCFSLFLNSIKRRLL